MNIAIVTAFRSMPDSYSLVNDVRDRIKMLNRYGHKTVFFGQEGCIGDGIECEIRAVLPRFKLEKDIVNQEAKTRIVEVLTKEMEEFDIAITDDLMYLRQFVTYREAIFEVGKNLPKLKWVHWVHSRIGEMLKLKMPNAKYIYMNYSHAEDFANHIGVGKDDVHVVFNDKDPRIFFNFHPLTRRLIHEFDLLNYEIMQIYPICSTRMDSKGVDKVIKIFSEFKKRGKKVKLIFCNSNARSKGQEIESKYKYAESLGLDKNKDIIFTSVLGNETVRGVPRDVVRDLFILSNVFIFPSLSEVCSNVLLEASMTKNLVVLNKDFAPFFDFGEEDKTVLGFHFGSTSHASFTERPKIEELAENILNELDKNKPLRQFLKIKDACNVDSIYTNQFMSLLNWALKNKV